LEAKRKDEEKIGEKKRKRRRNGEDGGRRMELPKLQICLRHCTEKNSM